MDGAIGRSWIVVVGAHGCLSIVVMSPRGHSLIIVMGPPLVVGGDGCSWPFIGPGGGPCGR